MKDHLKSNKNMSALYYSVLIFHSILTLFMAVGWVSNNSVVLKVLFGLLILGISLFLILGGCFITRIEKKLSGGSTYTIIDPVLHQLGITASRDTRTYFTMGIFLVSLFITSYKLFIREKKQKSYRVIYFIDCEE